MKHWSKVINLQEVMHRLNKFPDTFLLKDLSEILDVAKGTAIKATKQLELETRETPEGMTVNKAAFLVRLEAYYQEQVKLRHQ
ncbi:hypothetical protein RWV98_12120 [Agathobaculum sp. NTUH-O15-33]|uniref:hypothetical protein n=1 Tax=Agathobaculum sp. NTUH-O15-33 TaxID=3079302 RepID=UPI00295898CA|nr:hypothetical protein [Agathobaculum sp. NTUH-O15-33]WNX83357.1 hypothetical protein RWV98_12120 [Agathobaculum sp. NTUH-O15-33]